MDALTKKYRYNTRLFYYGKGTCSTALTFLNLKLAKEKKVSLDFFCVTHAADKDPVCQAAAIIHAHPVSSIWPTCRHVFGDFSQDRFEEQALLNSMVPDKGAPYEQRWAAYRDQARLMHSDPDRFLPDNATAWCFRHVKECPVIDTIGSENDTGHMYSSSLWQKRLEKAIATPVRNISTNKQAWASSASAAAAAVPTQSVPLADQFMALLERLFREKAADWQDIEINASQIPVLMTDIVDRIEKQGLDMDEAANFMRSQRFREHFRLEEESLYQKPSPASRSSSSAEEPLPADPLSLKELYFVLGGTTCVDMVGYGHGDGEAGSSMQAWNSFVTDIIKVQPVSICCEISGLDDLTYFRKKLGHLFALIGLQECPTGLGNGARRLKLYVWGTHKF